jgi:hypothetical protein
VIHTPGGKRETRMIWFIDPELRRTLLTEIAFQRYERSKFRRAADDESNPYGVQREAQMRAEGCNRAIRALRDVWDAQAAVERRRAANELAVEQVRYRIGDVSGWAPGELVEAFGK